VVFIIKKKLYARILQKGMPFLIIYLIFSSGLTISLYAMIFLTHTITLYIDFVALLIGITLCVISYKTDRLHNIFAALISITVMALLAITFSTYILLIILIILSVWDLIAVFKLKFMQALAQQAIDGHKGKMLPLFIYTGSKNELKNKLKPQSKENKPSGAALLGLGDIIFPGAVICSALLINDLLPLLLTLGFLIGLGADMILSAKYNKPLPALPLIFVGMIIFMIL
jgi:presenilin-like A22 family membrane protease